jgi:nitric oxide dioxygenase
MRDVHLSDRQIELVEGSWELVMLETDEAGLIFYGELFEIDPGLRPLFKEDIKSQAHVFVSLITFVVHKLKNIDVIAEDVKALGVRHKSYHVRPEHYQVVGEALLITLEKILGRKWNLEIKQAWSAVYNSLSAIMIDAANMD